MAFFAPGLSIAGKVAGALGIAQQAANLWSTVRGAHGSRSRSVAPTPPPPHAAIQAATGPQAAASRVREEIAVEQERGRQQRANMVLQSKLAIETERELWAIRSAGLGGARPPPVAPRSPYPVDTDSFVEEMRRALEGTGRRVPPRPGPRRYNRDHWRRVRDRFSPRR